MYVLVPAISDLRREDLLRIITAQTLPTASDNPGPTLPPTRTRSISVSVYISTTQIRPTFLYSKPNSKGKNTYLISAPTTRRG